MHLSEAGQADPSGSDGRHREHESWSGRYSACGLMRNCDLRRGLLARNLIKGPIRGALASHTGHVPNSPQRPEPTFDWPIGLGSQSGPVCGLERSRARQQLSPVRGTTTVQPHAGNIVHYGLAPYFSTCLA